ncbi:MAG: tyrosine-type recombinase/integrase [Desulfovibrionaceae bacterium]
MATWIRSGHPGVYYREHPTRRHGPRPDRYWTLRYTADGRRHHESLGWSSDGWTGERAAGILATLRENRRTGTGPVTLAALRAENRRDRAERDAENRRSALTFAGLADRYLAWARTAKSSWLDDEQRMHRHVLPALGGLPLAEISTEHVARLKESLETRPSVRTGRPLAPATVLQVLALVRQAFNFARETPLDPAVPSRPIHAGPNPARLTRRGGYGVRVPRMDNARLRTLTPPEEALLYEAACMAWPDHLDLLLLVFDTGLRREEAVRLRREHVAPDASVVHVVDTKGGRNRPAFPDRSRAMLARRLAEMRGPWLFPGPGGGPRDLDAVSRTVRRVVDLSGLDQGVTDPRLRITLHTGRHTYATRLYLATRDLYLVQRRLGHADMAVTQKYVHLAEAMEARLAATGRAGQ